jgi:hypothetical protein
MSCRGPEGVIWVRGFSGDRVGDAGTHDEEGLRMAASKRQTTRAKMDREQAVRERRVRKQQKREDRKHLAADAAAASGDAISEGADAAVPGE